MQTTTVSKILWFAKHALLAYVGAILGAITCVGLGLTGYRFSPSLLAAFWIPCAIVLAMACFLTVRYRRVRGLGVGAFIGTTVWMVAVIAATLRA